MRRIAPRRSRLPIRLEDLPEPHRIVLLILNEHGGLTWERLVEEAASKGIGEEELREVMGVDSPSSGAGA